MAATEALVDAAPGSALPSTIVPIDSKVKGVSEVGVVAVDTVGQC